MVREKKALSSHDGRDFGFIVDALAEEGYTVVALVIDAVRVLPIPSTLTLPSAIEIWHPSSLRSAVAKLSARSKDAWVWWSLPVPVPSFRSVIEDEPTNVEWHTKAGMFSESGSIS